MRQTQHQLNHLTPHTRPSPADLRLHADRTPHTRLDVLSWACLGLGVVSFVLAAVGGSILGAVIGGAGLVLAVVLQMYSATTSERWVILPAWVMSGLGLVLNLFWI